MLIGTTAATEPVSALMQRLQELGWNDGDNLVIDYREGAGDFERMRVYAADLVRLRPDVILAQSNPVLAAVRSASRSVPTVFVQVADPVGSGFIESLAHPGTDITGFTNFEPRLPANGLKQSRK
jgi:putative tryptophan/tyrosine transport system substrate-binding protein